MDLTDCMCSHARPYNNKKINLEKNKMFFIAALLFLLCLSSDVNDNVPFFLSSTYEATVPEGAEIGTSVAQVSATDLDSGLHGMVRHDCTCTDYLLTSSFSPAWASSSSFFLRSTMWSWRTRAGTHSSSASTRAAASSSLEPLLTASRKPHTWSRCSRRTAQSRPDRANRDNPTQVTHPDTQTVGWHI